ncbi:MAG: TonB-dependent receptor [Mangrovibacterium sp.]
MQRRIICSLQVFVILLASCCYHMVFGQNTVSLRGAVTDNLGMPLEQATVGLGEKVQTVTDKTGRFTFNQIHPSSYLLHVSFLGFKNRDQVIHLKADTTVNIGLIPQNNILGEVEVKDRLTGTYLREDSRNIRIVGEQFLKENLSGSLMQTLRRLPGVSSIDIGSGQSKPVIRGLSFNRVVVAENGIKHEAQEWGADHGLEIDQHGVERIELIKGPASLMYGSNAIGGVINLKQLSVPAEHTSGGSLDLSARSNNNFLGTSAMFFSRKEKWYLKGRVSLSGYGDYRVPTDSIEYLSYYFRLKDRHLRNTAGHEYTGSLTTGFVTGRASSHLTISNVYAKSGFFANAHGLEIRTSSIDYDHAQGDIDLPYHLVNHLKVMSNTSVPLNDYRLNIDLAYQNNLRREFSEPVAHGYMPVPPDSLEREFNKNTWTMNTQVLFPLKGLHQLTAGGNTEYQGNRIGGWGFILPAFRNISYGVFLHDKFSLSDRWVFNAGVRYDHGKISIEPYHDWYPTSGDDGSEVYRQRAVRFERSFDHLNWAAGANYNREQLAVKVNIGESFRMPIAKELAADGVNYHMYRYEKGDSSLHVERSYQFDAGITWDSKRWNLSLNPFVNYFPNYIYLNPTAAYFEGLQIYQHRESEVVRFGGELSFSCMLMRNLTASVDGEYIDSEQLSGEKKGFTLPFSPPASAVFSLRYEPDPRRFPIDRPYVTVEYNVVGDQNEIVPPEKKTPGYRLINLSMGGDVRVGDKQMKVNLLINNLFNEYYLDHTSFYRLIEVPGPGRNFSLAVQFHLGEK